MNIGVNQFCFPMSYDTRSAMEAAKRLGFDAIELCLTADQAAIQSRPSGGVTDALDIGGYYNPLLNISSGESEFRALRRMADDIGIRVSSVGGIVSFSIFPLTSADETVAGRSMDAVRRMLDAVQLLGADRILVIPGMLTAEMPYSEGFSRAQARIARLAEHAPGVRLLIENVWNNMLYSPLELNRFVDETGRKNVGVYFDVANARRFGYPERWIEAMRSRIGGVHVKDYRMSLDNINAFTNILDGDVNYPAVLAALKRTGFDGDLVVELVPPAHYMVEETLVHARRTLKILLENLKEETK